MTGMRWTSIILLVLAFSSEVWAGGALRTDINGVPLTWGQSLVFNPEQGELKNGVYNEVNSRALIGEAFGKWAAVSGINLDIFQGALLPDGGNTTKANYKNFLNSAATGCYDSDPMTPCYNPIIFDEDGSITEEVFGECAQFAIVGFAGISDVTDGSGNPDLTELRHGHAIFNGACIAPAITKQGCSPCNQVLDDKAVKAMILHELGHMLGMGHAQVNPDSYLTCNGGSCPAEVADHIPTMFPFMIRDANQTVLHKDDQSNFRRLYGNPALGFCTVKGRVFEEASGVDLRGVEVVARNTDSGLSNTDALAFISGAEAPRISTYDKSEGNCLEDCGDYEITGLTPGETYRLCAQRVLDKFTGSRALTPVDPPFQGVDNECPDGLTVTCECPGGGVCPTYAGVDLPTKNLGVDANTNFATLGDSGSAGGCSLVKPLRLRTQAWPRILKSLLKIPHWL